MEPNQGMNVDHEILIDTLSQAVGVARVREVKLEAAVQQLLAENARLRSENDQLAQPSVAGHPNVQVVPSN